MPKQFLNYGFGVITAALAGMLSTTAQADFIGLYASVDGMYTDNANNANSNSSDDSDGNWSGVYSIAFEHPVPLIPNVKLRYSDFGADSSEGNALYSVSESIDLQTLDAIGYYEILDNIVSVDAGLGVKRVDASHDYRASGAGNTAMISSSDADETIPALYVSAGGKLPFTGFSAKAEVMAGQNGDADFTDVNAEVKYNFIQNIALDLGVKFGYRAMTINFDNDSDSNLEKIEAKGPYLGLEAHF